MTNYTTIRRGPDPSDNFTIIANALLRDSGLTNKARGLLVQLLSHEPNWQISERSLAEQSGDSRTSIRSQLEEIQAAGYAAIVVDPKTGVRTITVAQTPVDKAVRNVPGYESDRPTGTNRDHPVVSKRDHKEDYPEDYLDNSKQLLPEAELAAAQQEVAHIPEETRTTGTANASAIRESMKKAPGEK